jgi:hypothetical protein
MELLAIRYYESKHKRGGIFISRGKMMFLSGSVMLLRSTSAGTLRKNKKKRQEKMKEDG